MISLVLNNFAGLLVNVFLYCSIVDGLSRLHFEKEVPVEGERLLGLSLRRLMMNLGGLGQALLWLCKGGTC
jgi:hypothetical protein